MATAPKKELTPKEIQAKIAEKNIESAAKAVELTKKLGVKVHFMSFITDPQASDFVVGFVKEPSRLVKARAIDRVKQGNPSLAYQELLEIVLIKEESDPRITSEASENDKYNLGACEFCGGLLIIAVDTNDTKKN